MPSIREAARQDLQWKRIKWWKREFELRYQADVFIQGR